MRDILPVVVDGLWRQGAKNLAVRLVSAEGQPLPAWTPGAHIDLHLPCGLIRQYSLTGSPAERDRYLLCIARESQSRGGSRYIHDTLRPGQPLLISAPRNHFPLHGGGHVVLLAAGIGITPLLAMAHARAASGASFTLHYYVSRAQEAASATEIARQLTGGICQIHCSDEGQSPRQRLAQDLQSVAVKFGQLIQKQDAVVCEAHLAGTRRAAAAHKARRTYRMMRRAERAVAHKPAAAGQHARHRIYLRRLHSLRAGERRQNARQTFGQHGFSRARRADQ